MNQYG